VSGEKANDTEKWLREGQGYVASLTLNMVASQRDANKRLHDFVGTGEKGAERASLTVEGDDLELLRYACTIAATLARMVPVLLMALTPDAETLRGVVDIIEIPSLGEHRVCHGGGRRRQSEPFEEHRGTALRRPFGENAQNVLATYRARASGEHGERIDDQ
jgi:hypothetical protein